MSLPNISNIAPTISLSTAQTVPLLLASIALEELALAHLVNAEAEKLQFVLGTLTPARTLSPATVSLTTLLAIDASVQRTLRDVIKKEMLLEFKFENVLDLIGSGAAGGGGGGFGCGCSVATVGAGGAIGGAVTIPGITIVLPPGPIIIGPITTAGVLNLNICPDCQSNGSIFNLNFTTGLPFGITNINVALDSLASVTCDPSGSIIIVGNGHLTVTAGTTTLLNLNGTMTITVNPDNSITVTVGGATITIPIPPIGSIIRPTCS